MKRTISFLFIVAYTCGFSQESKSLATLRSDTNAQITISNSTSNPNFIRFANGNLPNLQAKQALGQASEFLTNYFSAFNLSSAKDMVLVEDSVDNYGLKNVVYRQYYKGIPVYDGILKFNFNGQQKLSSINGNTIANIKVSTNPSISKSNAESIAKELVGRHVCLQKKVYFFLESVFCFKYRI